MTGNTEYQRDGQSQLIREGNIQYNYNLGGNRVSEGGQLQQKRLVATADGK